jgi:hypothetical protein
MSRKILIACSYSCVSCVWLCKFYSQECLQSGLFSAVLTAFVVESYQRLSPDTSYQMFLMMQQMSLQMSSFNTPIGIINSTYQPLFPIPVAETTDQPFQPSSTDICVNVLWFASLIFSLMTASFGILVKQWLREYLAVTNPSPQARLRIRHFRYPELQRWKVIEIAAVLPLLQQLSLALFFLGLCYFTESVHSSIGRTTLPLVAGWAFCFVTVTILPLIFPRCPYKTTLLKRLLVSLHGLLALSLRRLSWWLYMRSTAKLARIFESFEDRLDHHMRKSNEQGVVANESADLVILAEVDAVQLNDELLGTVIFESLQQIHNPSYKDVVNFVLRVLGHRLSLSNLEIQKPAPIDLCHLSRRGYYAIIDVLTYFMVTQDPRTLLEADEGIYAFHILFSESRFPLKLRRSGTRFLRTMFQDPLIRRDLAENLIETCAKDSPYGRTSWNYASLLRRMPEVLDSLGVDLEASLGFFEDTLDVWFYHTAHRPLSKFTIIGNLKAWDWSTIYEKRAVCCLSRIIVHHIIRHSSGRLRTPHGLAITGKTDEEDPRAILSPGKLSDAVYGMCNLVATVDAGFDEFRRVMISCLTVKEHTIEFLDAVRRTETPSFTHCFKASSITFSDLEDVSSTGIESLVTGLYQLDWTQIKPHYALRLIYLSVRLVTPRTARQFTYQWHILFDVLMDIAFVSLSTAYPSRVADSDSERSIEIVVNAIVKLTQSQPQFQSASKADFSNSLAECLSQIQVLDSWEYSHRSVQDTVDQQVRWLLEFTDEGYAYSDELVEMLAAMYFASSGVDADAFGWWRVQKLRMKERVRDAILAARADEAVPLSASGTSLTTDIIESNHDNTITVAAMDVVSSSRAWPQPSIAPAEKAVMNQDLTACYTDPEVMCHSGARERREKVLVAALKRQEKQKGRGLRKFVLSISIPYYSS